MRDGNLPGKLKTSLNSINFIALRRTFIIPRTYMHWTAVSAARGASRAAELAAKVTSAQDVLPTSGLLATAMEMPNIDRILAVNITV